MMVIHPAVAYVMGAIETRHGDHDFCLKHLARETGLSPSRIARLVRAETGIGFHEHLRRRRVMTAQSLLRTSPLPLKAIAAEAGFGTASQFSRQFRHSVGTTPTFFRDTIPDHVDVARE